MTRQVLYYSECGVGLLNIQLSMDLMNAAMLFVWV